MTLRLLASAAVAALLGASASAQTIGCEVGVANGGVIPSSGTGGGGTFPGIMPTAPSVFTLNVPSIPGGASVVTEVKLIGLTHSFLADVQLVLTTPSGTSHNLWVRGTTGVTSCDWNGNYTIVPQCVGLGQALPATCNGTTVLPPGSYDQFFGAGTTAWPSGTNNIFNTQLDTIPAATGLWTLTAYDWAGADVGTLTSFDVCFGTPLSPSVPTDVPVLATPVNNASVFGPVVDLTWGSTNCATSYDIEVDASVFSTAGTSFAYNSSPGSHNWRVRGVNSSGPGPWSAMNTFIDIGAQPNACIGQQLTTVPFTGGNGLSTGSVVYFDVNVLNPSGITLSQVNTNANAAAGVAFTLEVWTRPGTYVGATASATGWTLAATGSGASVGNNVAPGGVVEFPDIFLAPGVTGFGLRIIGAGHSYTDGNGSNQFFSNADLSISLGASQATMFSSTPFTPRVWNGTFRYNCSTFTAFCFGDGTGTPCPCGNTGAPGRGCANSTASGGALLTGSGSASVAAGNFVLVGSGAQPGQPGLYFQGNNAINNGNGILNGDGLRCAGGGIRRLQVVQAGGAASANPGGSQTNVNIAAVGAVNPGDTKRYQWWYRNPSPAAPCGTTFNLSNGLEVVWVP